MALETHYASVKVRAGVELSVGTENISLKCHTHPSQTLSLSMVRLWVHYGSVLKCLVNMVTETLSSTQ